MEDDQSDVNIEESVVDLEQIVIEEKCDEEMLLQRRDDAAEFI